MPRTELGLLPHTMSPEDAAISRSSAPLRVGLVSTHDPTDPRSLSGMPFSIRRALVEAGLEVVDLGRLDDDLLRRRDLLGQVGRFARRRVERMQEWVGLHEAARWERDPDAMEARFETRCRAMAARLASAIELHRPDVLFGNCISSPLAHLETSIPIVYTGDATAEIISQTYPQYRRLGPRYAACTDRIERTALSKVRFAAFASPATRDSAIDRYGVPADRAVVAPYGANLVPCDAMPVAIPAAPPSRSDLRLTITAADPERKQVDLALAATRLLQERGWNASITMIGPRRSTLATGRWATFLGMLDPADPRDLDRHRQAIAASHLCLQPSLGEAYGIAPIESAAFGKPAVATDIGGLPFVVRDGETGVVVPRLVDAAGLADAIESIAGDVPCYRRMSEAAHARHHGELNWTTWARVVAPLIRRAAAEAAR